MSTDHNLVVLSASDVDKVISELSIDDLINVAKAVFAPGLSPDGDNPTCPPRLTVAAPQHKALVMPARLPASSSTVGGTSIKVVSITNTIGLPASTLLLNEDGRVEALVNARKLTALRNAATSLLSTRLLFHCEPINIVAFGGGEQISAHLSLLFRAYASIRTCTIVARSTSTRANPLIQSLSNTFPQVQLHWIPQEESNDEALAEADIIVCATPSTTPLFYDLRMSLPHERKHLILIGSYTPEMHEIPAQLVHLADSVCVDDVEACLQEAGELIEAGLGPTDVVGLGTLIQSLTREVPLQSGLTIFKSVGTGLQDAAIARAVLNKARELNIGTTVPAYDS